MAEWLRSGLQSRLHRFASGWRLLEKAPRMRGFLLLGAVRRAANGYQPSTETRRLRPRDNGTARRRGARLRPRRRAKRYEHEGHALSRPLRPREDPARRASADQVEQEGELRAVRARLEIHRAARVPIAARAASDRER